MRSRCPPFEQRQATNLAKIECERNLARLTQHATQGGYGLADDDPRVVRKKTKFNALASEAKRLNDLDVVRGETWRAAAGVLSRVQSWLGDGRPANTVLEDVDGPEPTLSKGESITDAIERLRHRVRELKADLHRVQSRCYPSACEFRSDTNPFAIPQCRLVTAVQPNAAPDTSAAHAIDFVGGLLRR